MKNKFTLDDRISIVISLCYITFGIVLLTFKSNTSVWFIVFLGFYFAVIGVLSLIAKYTEKAKNKVADEFNKDFEDFLEEIRKINENEDSNL